MAEKNINARVQHKHDVEANWLKASSFVPKQGEIVVYDVDSTHTYERIKIGDGTTVVGSLPFVNDEIRQALTSGTTKVSKAETADRATTADSATSAQTAQTAVSAQTANSATIADTALVANSATKATQDGNGKVIADTYETKENVAAKIEQALLDSQADWDQTDSTKPDYIKNRTHWADTEQVYVTIVDNQYSDENFGVGYSVVISGVNSPLVEGNRYLVTFDGTDYSCMAYLADGYVSLGDSRLLGGDKNVNPMDVPFCLQYGEGWTEVIGDIMLTEDFLKVWDSSNGTISHTITIKEVTETLTYHKLDLEYLPEAIADWEQTDSTHPGFIKNKPDEEDAIELLMEMNLVEPVVDEDGSVYTDENGAMYTIV